MNLALLGKPEDMLDAARHYEYQPKHHDKAVMLYHKVRLWSDVDFSSVESILDCVYDP